MSIRTDLAVENLDLAMQTPGQKINGVERTEETKNGLSVTKVIISNDEAENTLGRQKGEYITIETTDFKLPSIDFNLEIETVAELLSSVIRRDMRGVLVVGLGNREITPDALGPAAIGYIFSTRHISSELQQKIGLSKLTPVCAIAPGVLGQTGIETAEIVEAVVKETKPSCVIVIDALASKSIDRLAKTIQISNTGISPGSGVQNSRKELNEATLGIPVISVGVPMVVDMATIAVDMLGEDNESKLPSGAGTMMVTPREIDVAIEHAAKLVGFAINRALQPDIELEDLFALVG